MTQTAFSGATLFDGAQFLQDRVLLVEDGRIAAILEHAPEGATPIRLAGGILAPGLLDLQVNGAAGLWVCGQTDPAALNLMCDTQARLGATGILPTLITDSREATYHVLDAAVTAAASGMDGLLGIHLEGPHLDPKRKGAHDLTLIRPMDDQDLEAICTAAGKLPALMVTVAPFSVTPEQIAKLTAAGVIVSLGHAECSFEEAAAAIKAGARCATHLFNAMSQMGHRSPGLVGAALTHPIYAGLIADGEHVSLPAMQVALAAKPQGIFLVSDCMSVAGTDIASFDLGGRRITRANGRLTLDDGTLAGADLTLPQAIANVVKLGLTPERALSMATSVPAALLGRQDIGNLQVGARADLVHLGADFALQAVWTKGEKRV